jgi:signal transduction histidine kinase
MSISVIDRDFQVVDANHNFTSTYGDWHERPCYWVYKGRSERCENCAAAKTFDDGKVRHREEKGVPRDGRPTYYFVQMVPLIREDGRIPYIIEMSTDITPTKQLEQEKLEAERLAAVGQTVAGLAHGIKNVLMGLEGGMYVVRSGMEKGDADRIVRGWQILEENIARITSFVKEFLEFAKGRVPTVEPVAPGHIAEQVIDLFRDKAKLAGIELEGRIQSDIPEAAMDEEAIHTALVNLVSNALDACEISEKPGRRVTLEVTDRDGVLAYTVRDDGAGMDYEVKRKVFTNFFSTKGSGKGTGLGLLTTRRIVQEHGGKVTFDSTEGVGSTFRLIFPRNRLPKTSDEEPDAAIGSSAAGRA